MRWKQLALSVTGRSHSDRNEPGQDYCRAGVLSLQDREFFIGIVADGAGSTVKGGIGAEITCETLYARIIDEIHTKEWSVGITDDEVMEWISVARTAVEDRAKKEGDRFREFACTLLGVVATEGYLLCFQIGDGCIVTGNGKRNFRAVFWPEQGEYANTTFFLTDEDYTNHIKIDHGTEPPQEIALFTDGLQNLVLSFGTKTVHEGFFSPLFAALLKNPDNGFVDLSRHLKALLTSESVNSRSDDDKTLVLAINTDKKN